jgi:hypothetical protein
MNRHRGSVDFIIRIDFRIFLIFLVTFTLCIQPTKNQCGSMRIWIYTGCVSKYMCFRNFVISSLLPNWKADFSLHCRQLPRGVVFSLIDVQLPGRAGFYFLMTSATWNAVLSLIDINYLEGVALLLLTSATWNASFSLYCCYLPGMAISLLWTSATWKDWLFSFLTSATWKPGFSLHCRQQPGMTAFSLIDVSYLEERAFTLH